LTTTKTPYINTMKISKIQHGGIYVLKSRLTGLFNGDSTVFLFVRVFGINLESNFVEVFPIGQPSQVLFAVNPEDLIDSAKF